jgi:ribonuclease HI
MMDENLSQVTIYTDGACLGNPGPGGFGVVLLHGRHRKELSGGYRLTTNNRMEVMAAIAALEALKHRCRVELHSDSQYLVNAMQKGWARRWRLQGWKRNRAEYARNQDLWEELLRLTDRHEVEFRWVPGHAGVPENERCDELSQKAAQSQPQQPDEGYEARRPGGLLWQTDQGAET